MSYYNIADFMEDCDAFNEIANNHTKLKWKDLMNQLKLIREEVDELDDALNDNLPVSALDGVVDILVTTLGMLQKFQKMGCDTLSALEDTAGNNLSKYPTTEDIAIQTGQHYAFPVTIDYNSRYDLFVIKDEDGKVRKPVGFKPNDLSKYVPKELREGGFDEFNE